MSDKDFHSPIFGGEGRSFGLLLTHSLLSHLYDPHHLHSLSLRPSIDPSTPLPSMTSEKERRASGKGRGRRWIDRRDNE